MSTVELAPPEAQPASVFAALGDTTRLQLISRLGDGRPRSIRQLGEGLELSRQGVTKHLRVLETAGLVTSSRVGREHRFRYAPESIDAARDYLDQVSAEWDEALGRLKAFVEFE